MKKISLYIIACLFAFVGLMPNQVQAQDVCDDGNYDCYFVIERDAKYTYYWGPWDCSLTVYQDDSEIGYYTTKGTDTLRVCSSKGKIDFELYDDWNEANGISLKITDSAGVELFNAGYGDIAPCSGCYTMLLEDVTACSSCLAPANITFDDVTATSATINFEGSADSYEYMLYSGSSYGAEWESTTSTSLSFDDLTTATTYYFKIRSICGSDTSYVVSKKFTTGCEEISTLPIKEDFEHGGEYPVCWARLEYGSSGSYIYPYVNANTYYGTAYVYPNGTYWLYMYNYYGNNTFCSPKITATEQTDVIFYAVAGSTPYLEVGYTTDTSDLESFVVVETVAIKTGSKLNRYVVPLPEISEPYHVVFRLKATSSSKTIYLDDITIAEHSDCGIPTKLEQDMTDNTSGQVTLNWQDTTNTKWQIAYGPSGFDPDGTSVQTASALSTTVTITGLSDDTTYDFYVRGDCGSEYSYWCDDVVTARPNSYKLNKYVDTITSCGITLVDDGGFGKYGYGGKSYMMTIMPETDEDAVKLTGKVNLYAYNTSTESYLTYLYIYDGSDTNGECLARYASNNVSSDNNVNLSSQSGPITLYFKLPDYNSYCGDGFELSVSCYPRPNCIAPSKFAFVGSYGEDAWFSWKPADETPDKYVLDIYDMDGNQVLTKDIDGEASTDTLTWGSLQENTDYKAVLSVVCDGEASSLTREVNFHTSCVVTREATIGDLASAYSDYYALCGYPYYGHNIGQHLYTAEEIGDELDTVSFIKMYVATGCSTPYNLDIYMENTDETSLSSFISPDTTAGKYSHRVFSGAVNMTAGEVTIYLDSTFIREADKGILVTYVLNNSGYISNYAYHYYSSNYGTMIYGSNSSGSTVDPWDNKPPYMYSSSYHMILTFGAPCGDKSCAPVRITSQTVTKNSITVAWNPGNTETAWNVDYRKDGESTWTNFVSNTAVQSCTITGLEGGTTYDVRIVTLCDGDKTIARSTRLTTECDELPVPYTIDFEDPIYFSSSANGVPNCWYRFGNSSGSYSYYPYNYSYYTHDGSYSAYYYQSGESTFPTIVTPQVSMDLNKLAVTFYYLCGYADYAGVLQVGAMTDPTDPSTFELIDTAHYDYTGYNNWGFNVVDLSSYTGTGRHIALRVYHGSSYNYTYVYLDDITIMEKPNCNFLIGSMGITGLSDNSLTVTVKSDRYGHDKYNVYVSTSDVLDKSTAFKGSSTTNVITVTGLTASTEYYVWIEGDCGNGDVSNLMPLGATRTLCNPIAVTKDSPYVNDCENEEDMLCLWQVASGNSAWHHSSEFTYTQTGMVPSSGTGCYWLQNYPGQSMLCMPTFDFSGLDTVAEFIFSLYQYNYDYYDPVQMSVWYRDSETADWTKLTDFTPTLGEYVTHYVKLPNSEGAKFYQIGILGVNQNNYYGASLDDFSVAAATPCAPPEFELTDLTSRSFTVNWHDGAYDDIRVQYRRPQDWTWSARNLEGEEGTGSGSGIVVPLSMNTTYMVRVAAVCDAGQYSRFSSTVNVTLPMCEDNVTALSYDANSDKVTIQDGLFGVDYYGPDNDYLGYYSYSEVLIDKSQLSGMTEIAAVTFTADSANEGKYLKNIQVYMANTTATELDGFLYDSTFKKVFTGDATYTEPGKVLIPLKSPFEWDGSSNIVIGFYGDGDSYAYDYDALYFAGHKSTTKNFVYARNSSYPSSLSDFILNLYDEEITTNPGVVPDIEAIGCKPVCYEPVVKSLTTTSNSIRVEWYREKNMDVEVSIRTTGTTAWDNPVTVKSTDGVAYTFTMLSAMTQYDIRLRRDCSGDGIGFSDEVIVSATTDTACSIPEMVKALDVSATTATLGWSNTTVANRWEIQVWNTGFNKYYKADSNPFTIDGLTPGNSYKVRVRAFCGSSDHVVGDWSETATFQNTCEPVTGLTATANGSNVVLNWTGSSKNKRYLVTWGENHFDPNEQIGYAEVNGTTYTVSGLKSKTYTFRVIGICDEGWYSDWSEVNATVVGIDDVEGQNAQFTLQPNPATDRVTLSLEAFEGTANVSILSVDGRQVSQFSTVENSTEINLSDMAAGTYFVRVQTEGWVSVRKLIVK